MMHQGKTVHMVTWVLVIIGGLNWLLQGLLGWEIGSYLPGGMLGTAARVVYILVGLSAVYELVMHKQICKMCRGEMGMSKPAMPGSGMMSGGPGMQR